LEWAWIPYEGENVVVIKITQDGEGKADPTAQKLRLWMTSGNSGAMNTWDG
jgi:hypothetical protein